MAGEYFEKDMGFDEFMTNLKKPSGKASVLVGWLRSSGVHKPKGKGKKGKGSSVTVAQLAAIMEFGSKDGKIPERSMVRATLKIHADQITALFRKLSLQVMTGKMDETKALGIAGAYVKSLIQKRIQDGIAPANAASTVRRKGSSKPLIDTGQLVGAVDFEVRKAGK